MAFRNPLTSLPASGITGQIIGSQIAADAINGKIITGATLRATWPDGSLAAIMADDPGDGQPGFRAYSPDGSTWSELSAGSVSFGADGLDLYDPIGLYGSATAAEMDIMSGSLDHDFNQARISLQGETATNGGAFIQITADGNSFNELNADVDGILTATNMQRGSVVITAGSGANVSASVSGVFMYGSKFRVYTTVVSGVPSNITGCTATAISFNGVNQLSFNIVLCRQGGSTATTVQWLAIGDYQ